ncbi:hypothetical protein NPIL_576321 [Nephila pilipes]|uniref:Uncharacterized protein n=1 Tax=Nephila pilipes TaxID=299642 RepID=A0A8X6NEL3_NEPPI|nr:hypothetical protein NPIL_576321 [Nephila pilipes]
MRQNIGWNHNPWEAAQIRQVALYRDFSRLAKADSSVHVNRFQKTKLAHIVISSENGLCPIIRQPPSSHHHQISPPCKCHLSISFICLSVL